MKISWKTFLLFLNMEIFHKLTNSASGTLEHNLLQYKIKLQKQNDNKREHHSEKRH